jgi:hypothetical protein
MSKTNKRPPRVKDERILVRIIKWTSMTPTTPKKILNPQIKK